LIVKAITQHGSLNRKDVDDLLWKKLPEWMDEKQRKIKINNMLSKLRKKGMIKNNGNIGFPKWVLVDNVSGGL